MNECCEKAIAEATAELRMVMACGHVVANMAEKDGQGYCLFCSAVEVWQAKLVEAEQLSQNRDQDRLRFQDERDAARTALAEAEAEIERQQHNRNVEGQMAQAALTQERERCCKAICEGCRKGWPVIRTPWCDAWHSDEPSVPTSGMPCKAAAIRAQEVPS